MRNHGIVSDWCCDFIYRHFELYKIWKTYCKCKIYVKYSLYVEIDCIWNRKKQGIDTNLRYWRLFLLLYMDCRNSYGIKFDLYVCRCSMFDFTGKLYARCNYKEIVSAGKLQRVSCNSFSFFMCYDLVCDVKLHVIG